MEPLEQHINDWKGCTLCSISCKHKVFYRGSKNPKILFVGDAPGKSESVLKKPFVGSSGKLLDLMIKESGIPAKICGFTNTVSCLPHNDNNKGTWRLPDESEVNNCRERLDDLIEALLPSYIISVGKIARMNAPTGMHYSLDLDHPVFILRKGGVNTYEYKRNRAELRNFYENKFNG